jgi:plastocyanin
MFGSLLPHRKDTARRVSVLYPLLKHLNTGTLAFAMFVAVALLSSTHGKDSETRASAPVIKTEVAIDNFSSSTITLTLPARATVTWTNNDNVPHVVASADNQFPKISRLEVCPELFTDLSDNGNLLLLLFHPPADDWRHHRQVNISPHQLHEIIT